MDQNGLHERRPGKEQDSDSSSKAETEVNFIEEHQRKKKTYGRTPDGTGMSYTYCPCMMRSVMGQYLINRLAAVESISSICHNVKFTIADRHINI